jgi:hypothetical protein
VSLSDLGSDLHFGSKLGCASSNDQAEGTDDYRSDPGRALGHKARMELQTCLALAVGPGVDFLGALPTALSGYGEKTGFDPKAAAGSGRRRLILD